MPDIYVSIATLPGRETSLSRTLTSLALQHKRPKAIFICVCPQYTRFSGTINTEAIFTEPLNRYIKWYNLQVTIISSPDYGSCTKLLASIDSVPDDAFILLMDDDVYYKPHIISDFHTHANYSSACSFDVEFPKLFPNILSGKGVNGFMMPAKLMRDIKSHYQTLIADEPLWKFQDDLLISLYLHTKNISIQNLKPFPDYCSYVYTIYTNCGNQMHVEQNYDIIYSELYKSYARLYIDPTTL